MNRSVAVFDMPIDVAKPKPTPAQVLQEMAQLTARQLDVVIERAAVLRLQKRKQVLGPREFDLLRIINRGLSDAHAAKLAELQEKLRNETISRREHAQLLRLTEELERLAAERLKALIDLSALRNTTVP